MTGPSPALVRSARRLRAVSLWNPHAGLMAIGAKNVESRGQKMGIPIGPVAIASTVAVGAEYRAPLTEQMQKDPFRKWLRPEGWTNLESMPRGCIVALVWTLGEYSATELIRQTILRTYGRDELEFGYYNAPGRVAIMTDPDRRIRLREPVPVRGKQGVWYVTPETCAAIRPQIETDPMFRHYSDYFEPAA